MLAQYGDRLVCVRYRYDAQRKTRFKTVELIVAQRDLRQRVKQAGGTWNPSRKVWELRYAHVVALKLQARIVEEAASDPGCRG